MRIGIPRELKPREGRVGLIPAACVELVRGGHEVFVEHSAGQPLDDTARRRAFDRGGAMLDLLELQEQLVGMPVAPAAEFAAVVGEHGLGLGGVRLEDRDSIAVHQVDGSNGHAGAA